MRPRDLILPLSLLAGFSALLWPRESAASAAPPHPGLPVVPGGRVLSVYGPRRKDDGSVGFHQGVDLAAPSGTPIHCPVDAVVVSVYPDGEVRGYGNVVTVRHGSVGLLFAHMATIAVRRGDVLSAGQLVGTVGSTNSEPSGFHTSGPHLHMEVMVPPSGSDLAQALAHYSGTSPPRMDPQAWAASQGVRLVG